MTNDEIRMTKQIAISSLLMLFTLIAGCGYQTSGVADKNINPGYQWHSLYREDYHSVAVPVFGNKSFRQGIEFRLTKAVIQQMESRTPYKVVPADRADTVLEGEISSIKLSTLSNDRTTNLPQEQIYTVAVNFIWKDLRTGKILVERRSFEQTAPFYNTLGEGQFVGSQDSVEKLAIAIVQEMQAEW